MRSPKGSGGSVLTQLLEYSPCVSVFPALGAPAHSWAVFGFPGGPWGEDEGGPEGWSLEGSKGTPGSPSSLPPPLPRSGLSYARRGVPNDPTR